MLPSSSTPRSQATANPLVKIDAPPPAGRSLFSGLPRRRAVWLGALTLLLVLPLTAFFERKTFEKFETWYSFEPGQEFEIDGSETLIKERSALQYYENVAFSLKLSELSQNSLGAKFSWDRRGSHFFDIVPTGEKKVVNSVLERASLWVWGGNYQHEIGMLFVRPRDSMSYVVSFGDLSFYGWKYMETGVPYLVSKDYKNYDPDTVYRFDRFRIFSNPREAVDNIYVFLDNFQVRSYLEENLFDGSDLAKVIREEITSARQQEATASEGEAPAEEGQEAPAAE